MSWIFLIVTFFQCSSRTDREIGSRNDLVKYQKNFPKYKHGLEGLCKNHHLIIILLALSHIQIISRDYTFHIVDYVSFPPFSSTVLRACMLLFASHGPQLLRGEQFVPKPWISTMTLTKTVTWITIFTCTTNSPSSLSSPKTRLAVTRSPTHLVAVEDSVTLLPGIKTISIINRILLIIAFLRPDWKLTGKWLDIYILFIV